MTINLRKLLSLAFVAGGAGFASAGLDFHFDHYVWSGSAGSSVVLSGSVTLDADWYVTLGQLDHPSNGLTTLTPTFESAFTSYISNRSGAPYSGPLFRFDLPLNTDPGLYYASGLDLAKLYLTAENGVTFQTRNDSYAVNVLAVPEPASLAALGVGLVALRRRRRN